MKNEKKKNSLRKFYENISEEKDIQHYINPTGVSRKKKILRMLSPHESDLICDFGCGDGIISGALVKKVKSVTGIDFSEEKLKRAEKKGIITVCEDVHSTSLKSNYFDKAICSEVLEHVIDPKSVLKEINRVLKPGGWLVLSVPLNERLNKNILDVSKKDLENMNFEQIKEKYGIENYHITSFSKSYLSEILKDAGFGLKQIYYTFEYSPIFKKRKSIYRIADKIQNYPNPLKEHLFYMILHLFYRKQKRYRHIIICAIKPA